MAMDKIQQATAAQKTMTEAKGGEIKKPPTLQQYLKSMEKEIAKALPSMISADRFTRIVMSTISSTPLLAQSTPQSFLAAMMQAAQLGLEPNTPLGQAYLIPYKNYKKGGIVETQFQLGYKGLIDLAYRSGQISVIQAHTVYANDDFEFSYGLEPTLKHVPAKKGRGNPDWFYGMFKTKDGGFGFEVMSLDEARAHGKQHSKSFNSGPWQTNFEEMAKKTVLKKALKYAPISSEFLKQLSADGTIKTEIGENMVDIAGDIVEPEVTIEAQAYTVDETTGEVIMGEKEENNA